jgi:hypothetical protein
MGFFKFSVTFGAFLEAFLSLQKLWICSCFYRALNFLEKLFKVLAKFTNQPNPTNKKRRHNQTKKTNKKLFRPEQHFSSKKTTLLFYYLFMKMKINIFESKNENMGFHDVENLFTLLC